MLASKVASSFHSEVVVIGAGVIGLSVARSLSKSGKEVILLEKESAIGTETSSRNSEVIHSGIYYPKSSNKARFCVGGKQLLYRYLEERNISHRKCGKLVVATNKTQLVDKLPYLFEQARLSGATDVRLLSREDANFLEPNVECLGALLSPSTGVLDSHSFYLNLLADCEDAGATLVLRSGVDDGGVLHDKVCLNTGGSLLSADIIINCAGLYAYEVATKIHKGSKGWQPPRQFFCKGTYFKLNGESPFQHLIYPIPEPAGLGVHATIDWSRNGTKFGPDVEWLGEETRPDDINYVPDSSRKDIFCTEIKKYWPDLPESKLIEDYVGIRPKLSHPSISNVSFNDFLILNKKVAQSRIVHLFGIESPGLTSSLNIAEHVRRMIDNP